MARQEVWSPESSEDEGEEQRLELSTLDSADILLPGMFNTIFAHAQLGFKKASSSFINSSYFFFTVNLKE